MKHYLLVAATVVGVAVLAVALIVPLWTMTAGVSLDPFAFKMVVLMAIGCFAVGGGLMFLIFYSARKGYDDQVNQGVDWKNPDEG